MKAATSAEPEADTTKPAVPIELTEGQAEPLADKTAEAAPAVKLEEKPAKPRGRRKVKAATSAEPEADTTKPAANITTEVEPTSMEKEETDVTT